MKKITWMKINFYLQWILALAMLSLIACKPATGDKFQALDSEVNGKTPIKISIKAHSPDVNLLTVASDSITTFGITLAESDSSITYSYMLDETTSLQTGANPTLLLNASNLAAGNHRLKVTASNAISSDSYTFNIYVNSAPNITAFVPTGLNNTNLFCNDTRQSFYAYYADTDLNDRIAIKWYLNNNLVNFTETNATISNDPGNNTAQLQYHPDCTQTGINTVRVDLNDGVEIKSLTWRVFVSPKVVIAISDFTPNTDPTILTDATATTFGVTLATADPTANFQFVLDNSIILQNDRRAYYSLSGKPLSTGSHTLKVTASNSTSSAEKIFNIRKNAPPTASSTSPALTGTTVDCGIPAITLTADMTDANNDSLSYQWFVDDSPTDNITPLNSGNRAQALFNPSCQIAGSRIVKVVVSDGYESTTITWSIRLAPPLPVQIASFSPMTSPSVLIGNQKTTFTVALSNVDQKVTYKFILKNLSTALSTTLQSSAVPYYTLDASTLSAGNFELTATATNGTYSDSHVFVLRKNSPPAVPPIPLTFSPNSSGTTIVCGQDSQIFQSAIADANNDAMTVQWYINELPASVGLVSNSTQSEARATYTPGCTEVGMKTVRVDVSDGYETTSRSWTINVITPVVIAISSFTPTANPLILNSNAKTTFGVTLGTADPTANYSFLLDNTTIVQSSLNAFYNFSAAGQNGGAHSLKVTASNATSSDQKTFDFTINRPTALVSFLPNLTGTTLNCGMASQILSAAFSEADPSDTVTLKWYLNNNLVSIGNPTAAIANDPANNVALLNFQPDCTQTGINFIRLDLNDGHEVTSQTWTVVVNAPVVISIADSIPTTDPTILGNTTSATFGVTLATTDSSATYQFLLDNSISLQNDKRSYYNLSGSGLSTGTHTLKVTASNSTSSATKVFNIKKNAPPTVGSFSPAYAGVNVNCGTAPITLYADMLDANGDSLTYTWLIDDAPSAHLIPSNSGNKAQATLSPNCELTGTRVVKAIVNDGYENTTVSWTIIIASPITLRITNFLPTTNPTILLASQTVTFGIALAATDANTVYNFQLKNLTTLVTSTLQSGTVPFYNLDSSTMAAGSYELTAMASNGTSSDSHVFTVKKNSPPAVPPSPLTYSPASTGVILNCGASSQVFQSAISDADNDIMSITWSLDNVADAANVVNNSTSTLAKATYTPSCAEVGLKSIRLDVFDGHERTSRNWTVSVINPTIVTINSYSPASDPVNVLSTGTQLFNVSATGKAPLAYEWSLDGTILAAATNDYTTLTAASLATGAHTLTVKVSDSDSNKTKTFNIIKNAPPTLSNLAPSNTNPKININTVINFSSNFSDDNNDILSVVWKLNGVAVISGNANATVAKNSSSSTLTFTPSAARIGDNTIQLDVSDGKETTSKVWNLNVNYFSDICNNLGAGKTCTLVGPPGRGSNIVASADPTKVMLRPHFITPYGNTTSFFISDTLFHVVWFYNKGATTVNILGQSIGPGVLKSVVGVGMCGTGTTGVQWNDFPLCNPRGIAWDSVNNRLFIVDEGNSRLYMVDSTGTVTTVMNYYASNSAAGNQDNTLALSNTWCQTPRGLELDSANRKLYVACASSSTVKVVDISSATPSLWTAKIVSGAAPAGVIVAGSNDGTNGYAGTNQFYNPMGLKLDTQNNILYVTDSGHCKIKAINLTNVDKTNYFFGSISLPANSTVTLLGNGVVGTACNTYVEGGVSSMRMGNGWNQLELLMNGSTLQGLFLSEWNTSLVALINNTSSSIVLGNQTVPSYQMLRIWNTSGSSGYYMPCTQAASTTCYLRNPGGLYLSGGKLYVADYSNYRVRSLDVSVTNGAVTDELGFDQKANYAGNGGTSAENVQFNQPISLYYDDTSSKLLISDFYNYRFRSLNLNTGRVDSFIGNGNGAANNSQIDPTIVGLQGPRNIVNYQGFYIYSDNQGNNCLLRAWNNLTSTQTILGISTYANAIQTVIGNWANGCGAWQSTTLTGTDSNARLYHPQGVTTDGTNIYFANTNAHCLIKVDQNGNMSVLSGLCNTSGAANGTGAAFGNTSLVRYYLPTSVLVDPRYPTSGNLFILDQTGGSVANKIRYLNQSSNAVTVYGVTINAGEIKTIYTAPDAHGASLAAFDSQVCITSGGDFNYVSNGSPTNANHNIICLNRDDLNGTALVRFGRNPSVYLSHAYIQENNEEEGIDARNMSLAGPAGLAFDPDGNLYVTEIYSHVIRKIKRWW